MLRSFCAVFAGILVNLLVVVLLTLLAVKAMGLKSGHPTSGYLVLNVAYSLGAALLGGWVTGRIARPRSLVHGYVLGAVMAILGILSYRHYHGLQPPWYQALLVVAPAACALLGAGWAGKQTGAA